MKVQSVDSAGVAKIVCEHCQAESLSFKPVERHMISLAFCGNCGVDSSGRSTPFNLDEFLKTGGA